MSHIFAASYILCPSLQVFATIAGVQQPPQDMSHAAAFQLACELEHDLLPAGSDVACKAFGKWVELVDDPRSGLTGWFDFMPDPDESEPDPEASYRIDEARWYADGCPALEEEEELQGNPDDPSDVGYAYPEDEAIANCGFDEFWTEGHFGSAFMLEDEVPF